MSRDGNTQQAAEKRPEKRRRSSWWRWGVSLAVFLIVLRWIDLGDFQVSLTRFRWWDLLLGFLFLGVALVLFRALRLWLILRTQDCPISFGKTLLIHWTGQFFGFLLPGTLGTDAWRIWAVSQTEEGTGGAMAAVAIDRVVGFVGQIANILLAWAIFGGILLRREAGGLLLNAGLFSLAALAALAFLSSARVAGSLTRLPILRIRKVKGVLTRLQESLQLLRQRSGRLPFILAIAAAGHFFNVLAVFVLANGLGAELAFGYYMALIPLALMATGLPISFSGLGVRDLTYVSLFQPLGVPAEIMLAASVAEFGLTILLRLIGGLFYVLSGGESAAAR